MKILLEVHQVQELFFRICKKHYYTKRLSQEKRKITDPDFQMVLMDKYKNQKYSKKAFKEEIYKPEDDEKEVGAQILYDLGLAVRESRPYAIQKSVLTGLMDYIDDNDYVIFPQKELMLWQAGTAKEVFVNTTWLLYFYFQSENKNAENGKSEGKKIGIVECVLDFKNFSTVILRSYNDREAKKEETYRGKWTIYNEGFIRMVMKLYNGERVEESEDEDHNDRVSKDLRIVIGITNTPKKPSVVIGQYYNLDYNNIFSGNTIAIPITVSEGESHRPRLIFKEKRSDSSNAYIPNTVWDFCLQEHSALKVPTPILSIDALDKTLQENEIKKAKRQNPSS